MGFTSQSIFRLVDFKIIRKVSGHYVEPELQILGSDIDSVSNVPNSLFSDGKVTNTLEMPANCQITFNNYYLMDYYKISSKKVKEIKLMYGTATWKQKINIPKN